MSELENRVLRVAEAAQLLGVAVSTAYAACRRGELPARRIGRRWVVPGAALRRWLEGKPCRPGSYGGEVARPEGRWC
ncbi:MAG TPA: helix-turn-helix domain-containing protein [Actinomycetota bacterium]|nr:helix-turn-helix domain-containing protein [Actinomycetota bacterium]